MCFNPLHKACFWTGAKLDKKSASALRGSSAHSILWIFIGLSTDAVDFLLARAVLCRRHVAKRSTGGRIDVVVPAKAPARPESNDFLRPDGLDLRLQEEEQGSSRHRRHERASTRLESAIRTQAAFTRLFLEQEANGNGRRRSAVLT